MIQDLGSGIGDNKVDGGQAESREIEKIKKIKKKIRLKCRSNSIGIQKLLLCMLYAEEKCSLLSSDTAFHSVQVISNKKTEKYEKTLEYNLIKKT